MRHFVEEFPVDAAQVLASGVRARFQGVDKVEFGEAAVELQSYAMGKALGTQHKVGATGEAEGEEVHVVAGSGPNECSPDDDHGVLACLDVAISEAEKPKAKKGSKKGGAKKGSKKAEAEAEAEEQEEGAEGEHNVGGPIATLTSRVLLRWVVRIVGQFLAEQVG